MDKYILYNIIKRVDNESIDSLLTIPETKALAKNVIRSRLAQRLSWKTAPEFILDDFKPCIEYKIKKIMKPGHDVILHFEYMDLATTDLENIFIMHFGQTLLVPVKQLVRHYSRKTFISY